MNRAFRDLVIALLDEHRILTIATNRPDGWPQATVVSYCNDGLVIYFFTDRDGQKVQNITQDTRVSIAIAKDYHRPLDIKGLSLAGNALVVDDTAEVDHAYRLLLTRYPEYRVLPKPNRKEIAMVRVMPELVSVVDYAKGYGHADLVRVTEDDLAEFVERRRHHWAGEKSARHDEDEPSPARSIRIKG
jgi:nitroimidazol reductase NimA-like FMN-containing flavoprotein (pyridoxamine 5'-phosphate oxidase superfamily)